MSLNIAVIPARAGSKRLPDKNIRLFCGKPLISWTIDAAIASNCFDVIAISSDSENILQIGKECGANYLHLREENIASDTAHIDDTLSALHQRLTEEYKTQISTLTLLQPTSPLRTATHIQEAMALFEEKNANAIVATTRCKHSPRVCNQLPKNGQMCGFVKEIPGRSQDLEPFFRVNGAIYVLGENQLPQTKNLYHQQALTYAYEMPNKFSIDIDSEEDFALAEFFMKRYRKELFL